MVGDPAVDQLVLLQPRPSGDTQFDWQRYPQYTFWESLGGVALTEKVLQQLRFDVEAIQVGSNGKTLKTLMRLVAAKTDEKGRCTELLPKGAAAKPDAKSNLYSLRVAAFEGYFPSAETKGSPVSRSNKTQVPFIVINDAGGETRQSQGAAALIGEAVDESTVILHKMHLPLTLESVLVNSLPPRNRKILVVTASDLRADGTRIRASLSWPMFLEDLKAASGKGMLGAALEIYHTVVVLVGEDGAFALGQDKSLTMAYDAGGAEGEHDAAIPGDVYGKTNVFACALLHSCMTGTEFAVTEDGLAKALSMTRQYSARCLSVAKLEGTTPLELPVVNPASDQDAAGLLKTTINDFGGRAGTVSQPDLLAKAREIVLKGESMLSDMPHARFGKFLTVDRVEIEGLRAIKSVINGYIDNPSQKDPISLAVFGPPGSGKSFGIKELIKDRPEISLRVFNLSEASAEALPGFFHEMRDVNLKGGMPLWFFDEFDSRGGELVARFLAPMQDGEMRDGTRIHPIGRGIMVFAGGTASTAAKFARTDDDAKRLKIPDFVSRLAGIIDIRGINRVGHTDTAFILRRAILLRGFLEKHRGDIFSTPKGELKIQEDLLTAFLQTAGYTHGARSMEKIIMAGALQGPRPIFGGSDLPGEGLLSLHLTDHRDFLARAAGKSGRGTA